jgi:hypothetical protein
MFERAIPVRPSLDSRSDVVGSGVIPRKATLEPPILPANCRSRRRPTGRTTAETHTSEGPWLKEEGPAGRTSTIGGSRQSDQWRIEPANANAIVPSASSARSEASGKALVGATSDGRVLLTRSTRLFLE